MSGPPLVNLRVHTDGEDPYLLEVLGRDVYVWESTGRGRSMADIAEAMPMKPAVEIAHIVARRLGKTERSLEDFAAITDVKPETPPEGTDPDPTNPAP